MPAALHILGLRTPPVAPPPGRSRARPLPPHLVALRDRLGLSERDWGIVPFGDARVDGCLPRGGIPLGQLHEIGAVALEAETGASTAGFVAGLLARLPSSRPILWIAPCADLYPPGLLAYGLDPGRLIFVSPRDQAGTLGAMEAGLRAGGLAAVVGEIGRLGRLASHRLQFACLSSGITGFALRRWPHGGREPDREATVVATRWTLAPAPSQAAHHEPGPPRWRVTLTHARGGREGEWICELPTEVDGASLAFRVVAELADYPATPPARARAG
ncbi:MAG: protein imuA [Alphaproteobacteria bacterium]|nr:protein imuA [Alphaproteobacteria bacterium]